MNSLNVGYFHIVFTLPSELNTLIYQNQNVCYNILFRAVSETLQELCTDKKYLGAKIGFTSILHTWGQNLSFHPHIHCVMAGGGLNSLGKWVNSRKKFLLPIKVLSRKFRGKVLTLLKDVNLEFYNNSNPFAIADLIDSATKRNELFTASHRLKLPLVLSNTLVMASLLMGTICPVIILPRRFLKFDS